MLDFEEITIALGSIKETNNDISSIVEWSSEEIFNKTGIRNRYISNSDQTAESLAKEAAKKIHAPNLEGIDLVISVSNTQNDDFPTIANHIHSMLNLDSNIQCYGLNHGCSGYVDAIKMVYSFFLSNFATKALVITSDTYSKFIKEDDRSTRTLFSDGATCTVIKKNLKTGWVLESSVSNSQLKSQDFLKKSNGFISMNGPQVLLFSINTVMKNLITIIPEEDCTIFAHQAGKIVLDTLKKKLPSNVSFPENYDIYANLVSSSIPNLLKEYVPFQNNTSKIILSGFGVGLSHTSILLSKK